MAWSEQVVELVRVYIDDMSDDPTFTDSRLERASIAAAAYLVQEVTFDTAYEVDILNSDISPDPSEDAEFILLLALKTSCLIANGEVRKYALQSVSISDGPSTINLGNRFNAIKAVNELCMDKYNRAIFLFKSGQLGHAIMTPTTNESVYPFQDF